MRATDQSERSLRESGDPGFDVILTNPPFAGEVRDRQILDGYELSRGKARIERDILFLERCLQLLRPGGRMAIVLPHNKLAVDSYGYVRRWLLREARVVAAEEGRSVSALLTDRLEAIVRERKAFDKARRRALARLREGLDLQWTPPKSRDELHER